MTLKAIIFDVDGTLAETEEVHRAAFNRAFEEAGLRWHWTQDDYRDLLTTTGGRERIARFLKEIGEADDPGRILSLHQRKNAIYGQLVTSGGLRPRSGIPELIAEARRRKLRLGVATTTTRSSLLALLTHSFAPDAPGWFSALVTGEDVSVKKPDPEAYLLALDRLGVSGAECLAIEDSRNGLDAALAAGIPTFVTPSFYTAHERFDGALRVCEAVSPELLDQPLN